MASQLIEEVTAHAQSDSLVDARKVCADGTYFLNNLYVLCASVITEEMGINEKGINQK